MLLMIAKGTALNSLVGERVGAMLLASILPAFPEESSKNMYPDNFLMDILSRVG